MAKIGVGLYLMLPAPEDVATGGATVLPTALLGVALVASGFGVKMPVIG